MYKMWSQTEFSYENYFSMIWIDHLNLKNEEMIWGDICYCC
jgi:hypothetical protein